MAFKVLRKETNTSARAGVLKTSQGKINSPAFMPIGTCLLYTSDAADE